MLIFSHFTLMYMYRYLLAYKQSSSNFLFMNVQIKYMFIMFNGMENNSVGSANLLYDQKLLRSLKWLQANY